MIECVAPIWGPENGPNTSDHVNSLLRNRRSKKRTLKWFRVLIKKAAAVWQWFHFLRRQVPLDKQLLLLNLDETSVRFWYEPRRGLRLKTNLGGRKREAARQASRSQLRKAVTHVAIICDDHTIQPHLPQIIIVNEHTVSAKSLKTWKPLPGTKTEVWRRKSAWINNEIFGQIVKKIGEAVRERAPNHQVILLMDAHVCHFSKQALREAAVQHIWPCIIPASTTSFLQPLDTHVFARFKMFLRTQMHYLMMAGENKDLSSDQVLQCLMKAIKGVLQKHRWAAVFQQNGFGRHLLVRPHLLETLGCTEQPCIVNEMPNLLQFQSCFPQGRLIPFDDLFRDVVQSKDPPRRKPRLKHMMKEVTEKPEPWSKRLRPRLHRFGGIAARTLKRPCSETPCTRRDEVTADAKMMRMTTTSGQLLPSLKPFPPRGRRSRFFP